MKNLLVILLLHMVTSCASADLWAPPTPQTVSSPNGEFLLRSIPSLSLDEKENKWSSMIFIVYELNQASQDYRETSRFSVDGLPLELFINDAGDRIVTMDEHYGQGEGPRVVAIYDTKGRELKKWALKDFYDKKMFGKMLDDTSFSHWRGRAGWTGDQKGIWILKPTLYGANEDDFDNYILDVKRLKIKKLVHPKYN